MKLVSLFLAVLALMQLTFSTSEQMIFPESYARFWEGSSQFDMRCADNLHTLKIGEIVPMEEYESERMTEVGGSGFKSVDENLDSIRAELKKAKNESVIDIGIARLPLYQTYAYLIAKAGIYSEALAPMPIFLTCFVDFGNIPSLCKEIRDAACEGMTHSTNAISVASYAAEKARDAALAEADELGEMGAGCEYYGPERITLSNAIKELNSSDSSSGLGEKISSAREAAWMVHDEFDKGDANFEDPNAFSNAVNLLAGSDSVVSDAASISNSLIAAQSSMNSSFADLLSSCELKEQELKNKLEELADEDYGLMDQQMVESLNSISHSGSAHGSINAQIPSDSLKKAQEKLSDAQMLMKEAEILKQNKARCYVSDAIARLQNASRQLDEGTAILSESKTEVDSWLADAEAALYEKRSNVNLTVAGMNASEASGIKQSAIKQLKNAEKTLSDARYLSAGKRAAAYEKTDEFLEDAMLLASEGSEANAQLAYSANQSIEELALIISKAEKDGIDCRTEREFADSVNETLEIATEEELVSARMRANEIKEMIFAKESAKFWDLDARLETLSGMLDYAAAYGAVSTEEEGMREAMDEIDTVSRNFTIGGKIDPRLAVGHYYAIKGIISDAETKFASGRNALISAALEKLARVSCKLDDVWLDEETTPRVIVELKNPFPFSSYGAVSLELENACELRASRIASWGYANADERKINVMLNQVGAGDARTIELSGESAFVARTVSETESIALISKYELVASKRIKFEATRQLEKLFARIELEKMPDYVSVAASGFASAEPKSYGALVTLERIKSSSEMLVNYSFRNPYGVSEDNYAFESGTNSSKIRACFDESVVANVRLPAFNMTIDFPNGTTSMDASVENLGAAIASVVVNRTLTWKVNAMDSGEQRRFRVCEEFVNATVYAQSILDSAEAKSDALRATGLLSSAELQRLEAKLNRANELLRNSSVDAVAAAQAALSEANAIEQNASARLSVKKMLEQSQDEFASARANLTGLADSVSLLGLSSDASSLRSSIAKADAASEEAQLAEVIADFQKAENLENDAIVLLKTAKSAKTNLSALFSKMSENFSQLEKKAANLSAFGIAMQFANPLSSANDALAKDKLIESANALLSARGEIAEMSATLNASYATIEANVTVAKEKFASNQTRDAQIKSFNLACKPTNSSNVTSRQLNETSEVQEMILNETRFFANYSAARDKQAFIAQNSAWAAYALANFEKIELGMERLEDATEQCKAVALDSLGEAKLKLEMAASLSPSYSSEIVAINTSIYSAEECADAGKFADSIVYSSKAISACSKLLSTATTASQNATKGFELQPLHVLVPALLLVLGAIYVKGKKPSEKKRIPTLEEENNEETNANGEKKQDEVGW